jgi:hypothetical protein
MAGKELPSGGLGGAAATQRHSAERTQRRHSDAAWYWKGRRVCGGVRVEATRTVERKAPKKRRVAASPLGKGSRRWASADGHAQWSGFSNGDTAARRGTTQRRRSDAAWFWKGRWVCGGVRVESTRTGGMIGPP